MEKCYCCEKIQINSWLRKDTCDKVSSFQPKKNINCGSIILCVKLIF